MKSNECYVCGEPISDDDESVTLTDEDTSVGYRAEMTLHERCVNQFWRDLVSRHQDPRKERV